LHNNKIENLGISQERKNPGVSFSKLALGHSLKALGPMIRPTYDLIIMYGAMVYDRLAKLQVSVTARCNAAIKI